MTDPHSRDAGPRGAQERYCYPDRLSNMVNRLSSPDAVTRPVDGEQPSLDVEHIPQPHHPLPERLGA